MDVAAALGMLGLERGPELTPDRVRRAYLRKLRAHPPERDPEGFQRLREAYELARLIVEIEAPLGDEGGDGARDGGDASEPAPLPERVAIDEPAPPLPERVAIDEPAPPLLFEARVPWAIAPGDALVDELLAHLAEGRHDDAAAAVARIDAEGLDDALHHGGLTVRWALARQLFDVADAIPDVIVAALARGLREGGLDAARAAVVAYRRDNFVRIGHVTATLATRAPELYGLIAWSLEGRAEQDARPPRRSRLDVLARLAGVFAVAAFIVLQMVRAADRVADEGAAEATPVETAPMSDAATLRRQILAAARAFESHVPTDPHVAAIQVMRAIDTGGCRELQQAVTRLERAVAGAADRADVDAPLRAIRTAADQLCALGIEAPRFVLPPAPPADDASDAAMLAEIRASASVLADAQLASPMQRTHAAGVAFAAMRHDCARLRVERDGLVAAATGSWRATTHVDAIRVRVDRLCREAR